MVLKICFKIRVTMDMGDYSKIKEPSRTGSFLFIQLRYVESLGWSFVFFPFGSLYTSYTPYDTFFLCLLNTFAYLTRKKKVTIEKFEKEMGDWCSCVGKDVYGMGI